MKNIDRIVLWAACLFCCNFLMAQTPVAYYPFSGNANDATGTLNGTVHGAMLTTDRFGNANSAYSFDGVDDAISFAALPMTNTDNFTLMAWVNPALFDPANQFNKMIVSLGPGENGYNMGMGNNNGSGGGNQLGGLYNLVSWLPSGAFFSTVNTWYHVAMVRENGVTKFYLNGVLAPNTFTADPNAFVTAFQIGGQDFDPTHYWNGKIDEVKIYNLALTSEQVQAEYANNAQSPIPATALQLWLRGDDGITKDINNKISAWADQSAAGRQVTQTIPTSQPVWVRNVINGHAVVRYAEGVSDFLSTNYRGPNTEEITIFVVAQGANISSAVRFQNVYPGSTGYVIYGYTHQGAENGFCVSNDGGEFNGLNCGFYNNSALQIGTARWKSNTTNGMQTFINGALLRQRNSNNSMLPNDTLQIGTGGAIDESTVGDIAEIIIYDRALTNAERLQVETYLNQKYRVTNNLAVSKPGSGNAISFDGFTQSVSIPNSAASNFGSGNFSVEFWLNSSGTDRDEILMSKRDDGCGDGQLWGVYKVPSGTVYLELHNPGNINQRISVPNVLDGKWHHISFIRNGTQLSGFRDGIQVDNHSATPINVNNSAALTIATGACAPFIAGGGLFEGKIDEFEIWNIALSQSELRDRMCHKITSSDPLYINLVAYYNFDESSGTTVFDGTVNANNGTLANNPARVTSGAPIGNASSHDYSNTIKAASITQANGESIAITSTNGNPDGIQLYSVNEQPNTLDGINTIGNSDAYFGVFQVNGTNPQYTAVYNYLGNPSVTALNEANLQLYNRADNAITSWAPLPAVPNTTAKTITVSGEHTEYLLGKTDIALPLTLLSFTAAKQNNSVQLKWTTRNEINTASFVVERSNGNNNFTAMGQVKASGHMAGAAYQLLDATPYTTGTTQYYRLKMIDNDGRWVYSNTIKINSNAQTIVSVYPNPASAVVTINSHKNQQGIITNAAGQTMRTITLINGSQTLHIAQWPAGLYLLKTQDQVIKIIKD
ncbi:LamG-like jellyroll fold domain-containing protein [Limnovirga soli]|uniref:T9SS type A sorting domain-containing protein n=1 Tax=Limnovirga soli TaxID=2656915 RepID=A0A8J8JV11_9BACT|nr:LamG-like jellyroll fold domain-containing protein [Limnovirga soli]NNV56885.1 T9SS type A sorting domain-containing protein [Limnovirga soli]